MHKKGIQIVKIIGSNITAWFGLLSPHLEWSVKQSCVCTCYFNLNIVRLSVKTTFWQGWLLCKNRIVSLSLVLHVYSNHVHLLQKTYRNKRCISCFLSHCFLLDEGSVYCCDTWALFTSRLQQCILLILLFQIK